MSKVATVCIDVMADGTVIVEEKFTTVEREPVYEMGSPYPITQRDVVRFETRRRVVSDPAELEALKLGF